MQTDHATLLSHIGTLMVKTNGVPFKGGRLVNTVKGVGIGHLGKPYYTFEEDDSCVEVAWCERWTPACGVALPLPDTAQ